jgi:sarcosine oxidase subunit beta
VLNTADVIIIGGGIQGVSLAYHLSQRGVYPIVLERKFIAAEATGYSSGMVRMHYDLELESRLAWVSFQYFQNWKEMVGGECGFSRTGFVQIVPAKYSEQLKANIVMHQKIGISCSLVSVEDVAQLAPYLETSGFEIAAYEPYSGYADPSTTAKAFMDAARREGARLIQGCQVTDIKVEAGKVIGVVTSHGDFFAPVVVNAAGAWVAQVGKMVNLELPVKAWRHDTMIIRNPGGIPAGQLTVIDDILGIYFRPESGGLT